LSCRNWRGVLVRVVVDVSFIFILWRNKMSIKANAVKSWLETHGHMSSKEIAECVGCDITYVNKIKRENGMKAKVIKAKKAKAVKVGRPNMFDNIEKACETLLKYVGARKNMCIAFDHNKGKVEVAYFDELYNVETNEVIDLLMAIKKLDTHRQTFN